MDPRLVIADPLSLQSMSKSSDWPVCPYQCGLVEVLPLMDATAK